MILWNAFSVSLPPVFLLPLFPLFSDLVFSQCSIYAWCFVPGWFFRSHIFSAWGSHLSNLSSMPKTLFHYLYSVGEACILGFDWTSWIFPFQVDLSLVNLFLLSWFKHFSSFHSTVCVLQSSLRSLNLFTLAISKALSCASVTLHFSGAVLVCVPFLGFCCTLWTLGEGNGRGLCSRECIWVPARCDHWGCCGECLSSYWGLTKVNDRLGDVRGSTGGREA